MLICDQFSTSLGTVTLVKSGRGVCFIGLPLAKPWDLEAWARRHYPSEDLKPAPDPFQQERREVREYADGTRKSFTFPLDRRSTPFSRQVLKEVGRVPYGATASYGDIARRLGRPGAARAVGRAVATNPLPIVNPCHRIVGSDGSLTGYGGGLSGGSSQTGLALKRDLLRMEQDGQ